MPARPSQHSTLIWRKSRASNANTECVEIACQGPSLLVRDSRNPETVLAFSAAAWSEFLRRIKNGDRLSVTG